MSSQGAWLLLLSLQASLAQGSRSSSLRQLAAAPLVGSADPNSAFAQLQELETEFGQISANDQSHMRKLLFNVQLRQVLKKKIHAELQRLDSDNAFLQGAVSHVQEMEQAQRNNAAIPSSTNKALMQLKKQLTMSEGQSSEQVAHQVLQHMQEMTTEIASLHGNDEHEIASLVANAQARNNLEKIIEQQKTKLDSDSGVMVKDLTKISSLAAAGGAVHQKQQVQTAEEIGLPAMPESQ